MSNLLSTNSCMFKEIYAWWPGCGLKSLEVNNIFAWWSELTTVLHLKILKMQARERVRLELYVCVYMNTCACLCIFICSAERMFHLLLIIAPIFWSLNIFHLQYIEELVICIFDICCVQMFWPWLSPLTAPNNIWRKDVIKRKNCRNVVKCGTLSQI